MRQDPVQLARQFIGYPTESQRTNVELATRVAALLRWAGLEVEELPYVDARGVNKLSLVARRGQGRGGLSLLTHSDTVPAHAADGWTDDPRAGVVRNGRLYGRGACDMKGALAACLCAAARFRNASLARPLCVVVTSDEEIQARGAREVVARSRLFAAAASGYGVVCEPTGLRVVNAHKGALTMTITAVGRAAHTSTLRGINANIKMIPFLGEMRRIHGQVLTLAKYRNPAFDPPYSEWSLGISDHNPAVNMSPARSVCTINYRPMPGIDAAGLVARTRASARRHGLRFRLDFHGEPVYTPPESPLVQAALEVTGTRKAHTVPYGTDGLAYSRKMKQLVVVGPGDIAQAHTVDEWVEVEQLRRSVDVYRRLIERVCVHGGA
jgi:acetylornithine deacetylase